MKEELLYFIWQLQYFDKQSLITTDYQPLQILSQGIRNEHSGPDFEQARIRLEPMEWIGSVEIHVRASDWDAHGHQHDEAYNRVVLHVVWQQDKKVLRQDGTLIPTLTLSNRVSAKVLQVYERLIFTPPAQQDIACAFHLPRVNNLVKLSMLEKTAVARLERKSQEILNRLKSNRGDWGETAYQTLFRSFGFRVNTDPLEQLSQSLPRSLVAHYQYNFTNLVALLLGQAGLLHEKDIPVEWQQQYKFLQKKHPLDPPALSRSQWRFFRTRPANFPTVRIIQLAKVLATYAANLSPLFRGQTLPEYYALFDTAARKYQDPTPVLGRESMHQILINAVIPYQFAYGMYLHEQPWKDQALSLLQAIPAEKNQVVSKYRKYGYSVATAFDTQAVLELHHQFCQPKKCLSCTIGGSIVKNSKIFVTSVSH